MKDFRRSTSAAATAGLLWMTIPLADVVYPWGRAGNRAYGHYDLVLFVGPLLMAVALPELFRLYAAQPAKSRWVRWVTIGGSFLLILGSFGWAYGDLLVGVGLASPLLLLALLIMSVGLVLLGISGIRGSRRTWEVWSPVVTGSVPFLWFATVLLIGFFSRSEAAFSRFVEGSFTVLIVSFGAAWFIQAFALASMSRSEP